MEYKQFSDIKGIFKNFFHKKEDFNNKGLISKKENFNTSKTGGALLLYLITAVMYVWSVYAVGLLPTWGGERPVRGYLQGFVLAGAAFLYVSILFFGQYIYYYYLGGEDEISELLKDNKWTVGPFVGYLVVIGLTFLIRLYQNRGDFWKAVGGDLLKKDKPGELVDADPRQQARVVAVEGEDIPKRPFRPIQEPSAAPQAAPPAAAGMPPELRRRADNYFKQK